MSKGASSSFIECTQSIISYLIQKIKEPSFWTTRLFSSNSTINWWQLMQQIHTPQTMNANGNESKAPTSSKKPQSPNFLAQFNDSKRIISKKITTFGNKQSNQIKKNYKTTPNTNPNPNPNSSQKFNRDRKREKEPHHCCPLRRIPCQRTRENEFSFERTQTVESDLQGSQDQNPTSSRKIQAERV